jgi:hypothetical protein
MNDAPQREQPSLVYQLIPIPFGIATGLMAGWLLAVVFSSNSGPLPSVPDLKDAIAGKITVSDLMVSAIDPAPAEADPVLSQPDILPDPLPEVAEIVPLPPPRPRSVPIPRPRPQSERRQASVEPRGFFDFLTNRVR